jgi:hypothetical protein
LQQFIEFVRFREHDFLQALAHTTGDRGYVSEKLASQLLEEFGIQFFALTPSQYEE